MRHKNKNKKIKKETLDFYIKSLKPLIEKVTDSTGYRLYNLTFITENETNYLRLTISHLDRPISLEDCEKVSRAVGKELDETGSIPFSYTLEVESPGITAEQSQEKSELILNHRDMLWAVRV